MVLEQCIQIILHGRYIPRTFRTNIGSLFFSWLLRIMSLLRIRNSTNQSFEGIQLMNGESISVATWPATLRRLLKDIANTSMESCFIPCLMRDSGNGHSWVLIPGLMTVGDKLEASSAALSLSIYLLRRQNGECVDAQWTSSRTLFELSQRKSFVNLLL